MRSRTWSIEIDLWIEPSDDAADAFLALQTAYATAFIGYLVGPGDPAPDPLTVMLTSFDVWPQRGGIDGYRGNAIFSLPGGI